MPIIVQFGRDWPSAASVIVPPITSGDCAKYPSFDELVRQEHASGRGVTVRAGVGLAKRTVAEMAASCAAVIPNPTSYAPDPLFVGGGASFFGTGFGSEVGQFHLTNGSTWAGSTIFYEQTVLGWENTVIALDAIVWGEPEMECWAYVLNQWGQRNPVGLHCAIMPP